MVSGIELELLSRTDPDPALLLAVEPEEPGIRLSLATRLSIATLAGLALLWWLAAHFALLPPLFLPSPEAVLHQLVAVAETGYVDATLAQHLGASLGRMALALAAACVTAVPIGIAMGLSPVGRGLFDPVIELYRPIPPLAYLPLIVIWFGIGEVSKVLIIFLAIFAPIAIATAAGVRTVSPDRVNAARSMGATRLQVVSLVVLPSALPDVLTGIRIGLGAGWSTLVAAELVAATRGLGFMVQSAAQFLVTDVVIMGIGVIAAVAIALELAIRLVQRLLVPWQGKV
jgi:taurine transport system permease protein